MEKADILEMTVKYLKSIQEKPQKQSDGMCKLSCSGMQFPVCETSMTFTKNSTFELANKIHRNQHQFCFMEEMKKVLVTSWQI